jgi:hypothetical protein
MERCPTCNATYREGKYCRRCGTDIGRLLEIREKGIRHHEEALAAYSAGDFSAMYRHARRAASLYRTPSSEKLLACAALLTERPRQALAAWTRTHSPMQGEGFQPSSFM